MRVPGGGGASWSTPSLNAPAPFSEEGAAVPAAIDPDPRRAHGCLLLGAKPEPPQVTQPPPGQGGAGPVLPPPTPLGQTQTNSLHVVALAYFCLLWLILARGVFPSDDAVFLHPPISAEECAVCVSSRKPKTPIMVSCPAASNSHSFTSFSPTLYLSTDDTLNLEGRGRRDQGLFGEAGPSS